MSEPIKLKVPAKPRAEFVSQGNFDAELKPGATIEVKDRRFADWLISEYDLTETGAKSQIQSGGANQSTPDLDAEYPRDFPKRKVFIGLGMPFETARNLTREQLIPINGIAGKTADAILEWQPAPVEDAEHAAEEILANGGQE